MSFLPPTIKRTTLINKPLLSVAVISKVSKEFRFQKARWQSLESYPSFLYGRPSERPLYLAIGDGTRVVVRLSFPALVLLVLDSPRVVNRGMTGGDISSFEVPVQRLEFVHGGTGNDGLEFFWFLALDDFHGLHESLEGIGGEIENETALANQQRNSSARRADFEARVLSDDLLFL
ncbi:hypothetical protein N7520_000368 [Penicillium odoratum]|uniref:uncharacterized protein n=1 Tax=Penicillium odoratum TaxID=1167516 RepID=UPI002548CCF8|nr:uncharacterized protein N7520_000368 [Penicillium odoratum]KAJ5777122.1 hypothetical protein N7520_000368 [Penicillium odoratum]